MSRLLAVLYAAVSYLSFLATILYAIGFIGNGVVPKTIDVGSAGVGAPALVVDLGLLGVFAVQHSVMARPSFKRWWTRVVPAPIERSTYVLFSNAALVLLFWQWVPMDGTVWHVAHAPGRAALLAIFWLGWGVALVSTFLINHFELFGLAQVYRAYRQKPLPNTGFVTPLLYQLVRHPLMLGFLLAFWATPHMTEGHLLFSIAMTAYIVVGTTLEERDLIAVLGTRYDDYRRRVPMLIPFSKRSRREPSG